MTNDFVEYWTAAKLLLTGGNPYSPEELFEAQKEIGWSQAEALIMWNPPWALSFIAPLGLLDYQTAQFVWFLSHVLIIFIGAQLLWRIYGGTPDQSHCALIATLLFAPVYLVLLLGQIGSLVLFGLISFIVSMKNKDWSPAAAASLTFAAIKPHLLYLLWLALFLWILHRRQWRLAVCLVLAGITVAGIPLLFDRQIYSQYLALLAHPDVVRPMEWATPSLGTALAEFLRAPSAWIRWLPSVAGTAWFLWYWFSRDKTWDWPTELPLVVIISVTTSSFVWTFDQIVLLPALIQATVWVSRFRVKRDRVLLIGSFVLLGVLVLVCKAIVRDDFWYFWLAPAYLSCYLFARATAKDRLLV